ncbi:uncharacterized protein LOC133879754 [Alnus glutinosa]|uniref:uncharacterized protein LOC133879754 n=1 Tax=Alnus glutinosa TaxID=3517 RepID=UPI002D79B77B|nr:uncharacterized protein LOC133879754 [Alnus glutinosa]
MVVGRSATPIESSPCKPSINSMALSRYNQSNSQLTIAPPSDSSEGCPAWTMSSLMAVLPESPSPTCSGSSSSPRESTKPEILHSQVLPIEFSTARNQSSSIDTKRHTSSTEVEKWMENAKTFCHFPHPYLQINNHSNAPDNEVSSLTSSSIERSRLSCANTTYGASEAESLDNERHKLLSRHKSYHAFLDEVKRQELDAEIDAWKKAKYLKLVHKLERKEAAINEWELKNAKKAMDEMKKYESKLERERLRALEKTNKRISMVKEEANRKKSKARRSTIEEISAVSRLSGRIQATKSFLLLKLTKKITTNT